MGVAVGVVDRAFEDRDAAVAALESGDAGRACGLALGALDALETAGEGGSVDAVSVLLVLSWAEAAAGDHFEARRCVDLAAGLLSDPPLDDPDLLRLWCQVQVWLAERERHDGDAVTAERRLLAVGGVAADGFCDRDEATLSAWNGLGMLYKYAARFDESEAAYRRVLDAVQADPDVDGLTLAGLFHNLGGLEHARGQAEVGVGWAERGLALRREAYGAGHPDVAADLNALGALYQQAGRLREAAVVYGQALTIFEACYGPDHYEVAMTLANQAALATDEARNDDAIELGQRCLAILENLLGHEHVDVGLTLHNLGVAHLDSGQAAEAVVLLEDAVGVLSAVLADGHPQLDATRQMVADARRG